MRIILGLLLAALCLPCGSATMQISDLATLAGVPIRVFDLRAEGVSASFREFLEAVPMTNDRPVPGRLIDDTVASVSFLKASIPGDAPAYFVAAWIHKTPLVSMPESDQSRYLERYGEQVFPQRVCPVFLSPSNGDAARLLSAATGLPAALFGNVPGDGASFDRLFALTEASHCGFIARELAQPTILPPRPGQAETRTMLEALGDFEATAVVRQQSAPSAGADEADVLFAARLAALFFAARETPYTAVPGLMLEYRRIGVAQTHRRLDGIRQSVRLAREAIRHDPGLSGLSGKSLEQATPGTLADAVEALRAAGRPAVEDPLAEKLIAALAPALRLLAGDRSVRLFPPPGADDMPPVLVTLRGSIPF